MAAIFPESEWSAGRILFGHGEGETGGCPLMAMRKRLVSCPGPAVFLVSRRVDCRRGGLIPIFGIRDPRLTSVSAFRRWRQAAGRNCRRGGDAPGAAACAPE